MNLKDLDILNNVPCGIFSFSAGGLLESINDTLLKQLKYTREELLGQPVLKILTLSSRIFYQTHFFPLLTLQSEVNEIFLTLLCADNDIIPVLLNATQQKVSSGTTNVCACIIVNKRNKYEDQILEARKIAEDSLQKNELLKKTQQELEAGKQELDKQLTHLKYTNQELLQLNELVTHDLQEPLRKINLYADLILTDKEKPYDKKTAASFTVIINSVKRIRSLLQILQSYLPILTDTFEKSKVDLNELINNQLRIIREDNREISFDAVIEKLPVIEGDPKQLNMLFGELLKNAVAFNKPGRRLQIQISGSIIEENFYNSIEGKYKYVEFAQLIITDNGRGFKPIYNDLIFKILKKVDSNSKGAGVGLTFCKRIVENHRGIIKASGNEGQGAKFTIVLPVN